MADFDRACAVCNKAFTTTLAKKVLCSSACRLVKRIDDQRVYREKHSEAIQARRKAERDRRAAAIASKK